MEDPAVYNFLLYHATEGESPERIVALLVENGWPEETAWQAWEDFESEAQEPGKAGNKGAKTQKAVKVVMAAVLVGASCYLFQPGGAGIRVKDWLISESGHVAGQDQVASGTHGGVAGEVATPGLGGEATSQVAGVITENGVLGEPASQSATLAKESYTIAIFGDSMVDTMGDTLEPLARMLNEKYPGVEFKLYNYGTGAQNVEEGLARFDSPFSYRAREYPPIAALEPDVVIIGSFAYNPFAPHSRDRHWLTLAQLMEKARGVTPNSYLLVEIAPRGGKFGGKVLDWPEEVRLQHARNIGEQLENALGLAAELEMEAIDVYSLSRGEAEFAGEEYANPDDGIHPSEKGHELTVRAILEKVGLDGEADATASGEVKAGR